MLRSRLQQKSLMMTKDLKSGATCTLGVYIDHTFYERVARSLLSVAVSKAVQHIAEADFIFRTTDMDLDAVPDKIGFKIHRSITVFQTANHQMGDTSLGSMDFMDRFSSNNFDNFCLAIAFTCRNFGQNIVIFVTLYLATFNSSAYKNARLCIFVLYL